jgi:hypothetical protein
MRLKQLGLILMMVSLTTACAGFPFWTGEPTAPDTTSTRVDLQLQNIRYDGEELSGRLLVSTAEGRLVLDKRLIESISLTIRSVKDCNSDQPTKFLIMDVLTSRPREEDILVLEPGYWYGKDIQITLFNERLTGQRGPDCIDAEFAFHALGGKPIARLNVHATRTPPSSTAKQDGESAEGQPGSQTM